MELLAPYLHEIEKAINALSVPRQPVNLYEPYRYMLALGGKRIRPALTLLACDACDGIKSNAMHIAMGIELFHNFTLVHDDIMDNAPIRRGRPTIHEQWNRNIAILTGDVMLVNVYQQLSHLPAEVLAPVLHLFNTTAQQICEGQQMDMDYEDRADVKMYEYEEMIKLKTAVLLGCALQSGALCSGTNAANGEHLYNYGVSLGMAFQVKDDYLDAYGAEEVFGKQKGGDILANKKTFLVLKFLEKANETDKRELLNLYAEARVPEALKIKRVLELFNQYAIDKEILSLGETYYQKAIEELNKCTLPEEKKQPLRNFAQQLMQRNH